MTISFPLICIFRNICMSGNHLSLLLIVSRHLFFSKWCLSKWMLRLIWHLHNRHHTPYGSVCLFSWWWRQRTTTDTQPFSESRLISLVDDEERFTAFRIPTKHISRRRLVSLRPWKGTWRQETQEMMMRSLIFKPSTWELELFFHVHWWYIVNSVVVILWRENKGDSSMSSLLGEHDSIMRERQVSQLCCVL